jgi:two-component system LytT family response regulator/two-component system response regulator LytT
MSFRATAPLTAIVADDEELALSELLHLLKDFGDVEVIATASDGLKAVEAIESLEPDLVFLDVQMPGLDGMGVIRRLKERDVPLPHFIMSTAFDQYAVEAFQLETLDYLLKPVEKERLGQAIDRARRAVDERHRAAEAATPVRSGPVRSKILVRQGAKNLIVDAADVIYVTIDEGVITVVTPDLEGFANYRTIDEMQSDLDPQLFWRVHRSFLVNVNRIREVVPWFKSSFQVKMDDRKQTLVPVSRVQTKKLRSLLKM